MLVTVVVVVVLVVLVVADGEIYDGGAGIGGFGSHGSNGVPLVLCQVSLSIRVSRLCKGADRVTLCGHCWHLLLMQ